MLFDEHFVMLVYAIMSCSVYMSLRLHCDGGQARLGRESKNKDIGIL